MESTFQKRQKKLAETPVIESTTPVLVSTEVTSVEEPKYETYEDFPYSDLLTYAGMDCIVTSKILNKTAPLLTESPKFIEFFDAGVQRSINLMPHIDSIIRYTTPAHDFICDMEINGFKYDVNRNAQIKKDMEKELGELEESIQTVTGLKGEELNSGKILGDYLYGTRGLTPPFNTKTGTPSTDGDALKELAKSTGFKWLSDIAKRNDIASAYRTFVQNYVAEHVKRDGRIHPSYNIHGTSSFRITGDNPNLTQVPRAKHGYNVKECFSVDEGNIFITFDFSSAEVKILGALCRDPKLLKAIEDGLDFHSYSAAAMNKLDYDEFVAILADDSHPLYKKYKGLRQDAKALT